MVVRLKIIFIGMVALVVIISACQPNTPPALPPPTVDPNIPAQTLTALIQTLTALSVTTAAPPIPESPTPTLSPTVEPTSLPTSTAIPATATIFVPPSPAVPLASVSLGTNCRTGPGKAYEDVGNAEVGIRYEVVGKSTSTNYWIIKLQDGRQCWLWGEYATVDGNVAGLPEVASPPTAVPLLGSILVRVRGPDKYGNNNAPILNATVKITLIEEVRPENLGKGQYLFKNVPIGEKAIVATAPEYSSGYGSAVVTVGQVKEVSIGLVWVVPNLRGCATLPTISQRLKCYQGLEQLPPIDEPVPALP